MHCKTAITVLTLSLSLVGVRDLQAQRSGFIIGLGLGGGLTTYTVSSNGDSDRDTQLGVAIDFKIGAQASQSLQVYFLNRVQYFNPDSPFGNLVHAGFLGAGVTYVLPTAPVHVSGGIGFALFNEIALEGDTDNFVGLGLTGGLGYEFADLWLLDFAVTYAPSEAEGEGERELNVFQARIGLSILSH